MTAWRVVLFLYVAVVLVAPLAVMAMCVWNVWFLDHPRPGEPPTAAQFREKHP